MFKLKTYTSVILYSVIMFIIFVMATVVSQNLLIETNLPITLSSYLQYIIIMLILVISNVMLTKVPIFFTSKIPFKKKIIPYVLLIIFIVYSMRPTMTHALSFDEYLFNSIAYVFGTAITQEYLFSGVILNALIRNLKKFSRSGIIMQIILTSLLFAAYYIVQAVRVESYEQVIYAFSFGLVVTSLYMATGSIVPSIILHFIFDFVSYIFPDNAINPTLTALGCLVASIILLIPLLKDKYIDPRLYNYIGKN
ncbi:CPBP family intramembrane metalloprotease [Apilactobacillus apisilvae]|uniref:CPBP family intramembrane metalloprotease n=1 Tax=Apilactobacillus apisilvae TaxID=2923364 RepID=A0ABY4PGM4_9LACO|nr:CPBP family intramembrane glutamic endopeptidase [Apilactobacillus apisilvae]UQS84720.1 CPBP family intramembrane metalloprotease [Apilactobacillus apisilvae]